MRSPRRGMAAAVLGLEAIALGLTTPVLVSVANVDTSVSLAIGLGLMVLCFVGAAMLRRAFGFALGWVIQVAAVALGFVIPIMFVLGGIFALLWAMADFLGRKIERERAEAYAAAGMEPPTQ